MLNRILVEPRYAKNVVIYIEEYAPSNVQDAQYQLKKYLDVITWCADANISFVGYVVDNIQEFIIVYGMSVDAQVFIENKLN